MDKDHANSIAISEILDKLGFRPQLIGKNKALYFSPFGKQKPPAFWVYFKRNDWHDYSTHAGGKLTDFACRYLKFTGEDYTLADTLRWIGNLSGAPSPRQAGPTTNPAPALQIRCIDEIRLAGLAQYLHERCIPLILAKRYMKQLKIFNSNSGRTFIALGAKNESEGYQLHNPLFSGFAGPDGVTFIRGTNPRSEQIHVFKSIFDFLSVLAHLNCETWEHDTILLHAGSNALQSAHYILHYGYKALHTWLDNDEAGRKAETIVRELLKDDGQIRHIRMNRMYAPHKNVNAWHMHKNNLVL